MRWRLPRARRTSAPSGAAALAGSAGPEVVHVFVVACGSPALADAGSDPQVGARYGADLDRAAVATRIASPAHATAEAPSVETPARHLQPPNAAWPGAVPLAKVIAGRVIRVPPRQPLARRDNGRRRRVDELRHGLDRVAMAHVEAEPERSFCVWVEGDARCLVASGCRVRPAGVDARAARIARAGRIVRRREGDPSASTAGVAVVRTRAEGRREDPVRNRHDIGDRTRARARRRGGKENSRECQPYAAPHAAV